MSNLICGICAVGGKINLTRDNRDETGYNSIDEIKYLVDIPTDCDVKDIWAVAGYYAKDDSECDTRLKELKNIYDEGGVKAIVDERVIYK